jgi:hypothetical protein
MTPKQIAATLNELLQSGRWSDYLTDGRLRIPVPGCGLVVSCQGRADALQRVADKYARGWKRSGSATRYYGVNAGRGINVNPLTPSRARA